MLKVLPECDLYNCEKCPHCKYKERGKIDKKYRITSSKYQQMADRVAILKEKSPYKLLFCTLTFPPFRKDYTPKTIYEHEKNLNDAFSKFIENIRKNYDCKGYVAVREGHQNAKRYHYHVICAIPFVPFNKLNSAWCHAIKDICEFSARAFTTDAKARFIRDTSGAVKYVCKYLSKSKGSYSDTRIIFTDRDTAQELTKMQIEDLEELREVYSFDTYQLNEYVTRLTVSDKKQFKNFYNYVVRSYFDLHNKAEYLYTFATEFQ